ncbi:hypothetical protein ACP70R_036251 [Stipagrostis hirtigluma subsp. patula]
MGAPPGSSYIVLVFMFSAMLVLFFSALTWIQALLSLPLGVLIAVILLVGGFTGLLARHES